MTKLVRLKSMMRKLPPPADEAKPRDAKAWPRTVTIIVSSGILLACGTTTRLDLRFYDATGVVKAQVTAGDVIRSSARAGREPDGHAFLYFRLTSTGVAHFRSLTHGLARLGAKAHRFEAAAFEINGRVYARPQVDYRQFPDGMDAQPGLDIGIASLDFARRLAKEIRGG
jgi:hypothetical protein